MSTALVPKPANKIAVPSKPSHLTWLKELSPVITGEKRTVHVWEFKHQPSATLLSTWACHFRQHYCHDSMIDMLRTGTGLSRPEYLRNLKFPDAKTKPGPSVRAGDFAEILAADFFEFVLGYWVPRDRYQHKPVRNDSVKGSDLLGFWIDPQAKSDVLVCVEAKARFSGKKPSDRLQDAVNASANDPVRRSETLNWLKQKFIERAQGAKAGVIERFQDPIGRPYEEKYVAIAVMDSKIFDAATVASTVCSTHPSAAALNLIVIHGPEMMTLAHNLYKVAADEA